MPPQFLWPRLVGCAHAHLCEIGRGPVQACFWHRRRVASRQVLARAGCPVDARAINGSTPLHWAAGGGQTAVVRALLAAGASAEARSSTWCASVRGSDSGQTPAHWAAASGHGETLALLLAAAPHALVLNDERQLTPAGVAAREGYEGLQRALDHLRDQKVVCVRVRRELAIKRRLHA
eukprot:6200299-Pleurochrysis_carterae.AAC.4